MIVEDNHWLPFACACNSPTAERVGHPQRAKDLNSYVQLAILA
jgi:hypothetical protein